MLVVKIVKKEQVASENRPSSSLLPTSLLPSSLLPTSLLQRSHFWWQLLYNLMSYQLGALVLCMTMRCSRMSFFAQTRKASCCACEQYIGMDAKRDTQDKPQNDHKWITRGLRGSSSSEKLLSKRTSHQDDIYSPLQYFSLGLVTIMLKIEAESAAHNLSSDAHPTLPKPVRFHCTSAISTLPATPIHQDYCR